jgi:hypothetical protein
MGVCACIRGFLKHLCARKIVLDILPLSIYSKPHAVHLRVRSRGGGNMEDSKIVIALKKFKADYAWDKSLSPQSSTVSSKSALAEPQSQSSHGAIEEFMASFPTATRMNIGCE